MALPQQLYLRHPLVDAKNDMGRQSKTFSPHIITTTLCLGIENYFTNNYVQLFLHFKGPAQILIQSRGSALRDALTIRDVNEIADSPAGAVSRALANESGHPATTAEGTPLTIAAPTKTSIASVEGGSVKFEDAKAM